MVSGGHQLAHDADHLDGVVVVALVEEQLSSSIGDQGPIEEFVDAHFHGRREQRYRAAARKVGTKR
jgi:hypothetical protein